VLIVEDNIINQTVLKRQMNKAGFTCDGKSIYINDCSAFAAMLTLFCHPVADNGQEALDRLHQAQPISDTESKATPYDVVLMDLEMPSKSWWRESWAQDLMVYIF
jgi:CheY-like chemotaxis protein